ncbi:MULTISPECIES: alpha-L-rhamnosidase-related protein [unclassified Alteromonas]|uniref:alpha-L-rhamnosidase-related protein n=1 Tax=unclassified Alteromonas TaxID=2614992 RepID=UPI000509B8B5|nr:MULTISPECIES: alpha-L-rhamnosidase C-terminal domain-containing protein [unclassified Alteromonas]
MRIREIIIASFVILSSTFSLPATAVEWSAEWIWAKERFTEPNSWMAFRKKISLDEQPEASVAYISADTKYWLWINGKLVVFEGSYTGGPSPVTPAPRTDFFPIASNKYYDEVDISQYLTEGTNTIAALVWYYGDNGQKGTHISSNKGGFIFQADAGDTRIISDDSWKVNPHSAYNAKVTKQSPYRVAAWNIDYDARNSMGDWTDGAWYKTEYDDTSWASAKSLLRPPRAPFNALFPSEIPILHNYGLTHCENYPASKFPFESNGETIKCVLDFNKNITPYFDIEAEQGLQVHIDSNMRLNTIETTYTTKKGRQQFESYSWFNARTIEYTFPKGVTVHGLKYRWTGVGSTPGHFETDDSWFTRIWQMAENTLYICARDNFMDTPDRERGLWIGDVADQASYLFYSMDKPGRDLLKKAIKVTLAFSDSETGIFAGLGPGRFRELPAQSLQFVEQGIWHYYYNTGDHETLEFAYPYVHKYLTLWDLRENGLATFRSGAWKWTDWGPQETIDYDVIQNALYYSALVSARNMALALNNQTHLIFYDSRIAALKKAFRTTFWHDGFYSSNPKVFKDDRANAVAILFGLADESQYDAIVDNVLIPNHFASPHFEWMVYNAMAIAGRYGDALSRMKERYGKQVANPARSTLTEYMNGGGTENHAWNAPSTVLSKYIAGIAPTSVAWETYQVLPNMVHMKRIEQRVPSVQGDIDFTISRTSESLTLELNSPSNTVARVGVPKEYFNISNIVVNGNVAWQTGQVKNSVDGVRFVSENSKYILLDVAPGAWKIDAN